MLRYAQSLACMDLILCHTTADFDTLGAAVGLTFLHPGSRIVLAGGAHPAVRDFLALHRDEYPLLERRSVNAEQLQHIFVVDTCRRDRLGKTAEWLDLSHVEVSLYDHHPDAICDVPAKRSRVESVGSTTTLIVEEMQSAEITPNPMAATVMALGIHVDTGSLTYGHTTVRDARALAWLMEQGANLRAIAEYVDPGLSSDLQDVLSMALDELQTETVQGFAIGSVLLRLSGFTPGLSSVVGRLMEVTELDALLFAAAYCRENDCEIETAPESMLTVIGRSRIDGTDLNTLFAGLGGGGHPRAAAVNLRDVEPALTLAMLVKQFKDQIPQPPIARELMSSPVRTIRPNTTIGEAQRILLRYGHSGLSVVDASDQLVGIISRRDLDIALHHGFSHAPVRGYMTTNVKTITPTTPLPEIESLMVTYDIGRLPVLANGQLVGIVTRTDVLRQLHRQSLQRNGHHAFLGAAWEGSSCPLTLPLFDNQPQALLEQLYQAIVPELAQLLREAATAAGDRGWHLYLVGGGVRDLLLSLMNGNSHTYEKLLLQDIDLVVDGFHTAAEVGAGVELARSLQQHYSQVRLEIHGKFQTAALLWHHDPVFQSLWIDIATARTEFYPYPAANPEVEASSIQQDLYRRDFTINAMALRLTEPRAGDLLDYFGGLLDLQAKQVRVLHTNSFIEDPTRIFRAVRFAVRLGFALEPQTESSIRHAIASGIYHQVQAQREVAPALQTRLRAELQLILESPYWYEALQKLGELGAFRCIHSQLEPTQALWRRLRLTQRFLQTKGSLQQLEFSNTPTWLLLLEVILAQLPASEGAKVGTNLQLPHTSIQRLAMRETAQIQVFENLPKCDRPSQIVHVLRGYDPILLVWLMLDLPRPLRRLVWRYLTEWSQVQAPLDGNDLKLMGYKPGPKFRDMLERLMAATLDQEITDRKSAEVFLQQHFSP